MRKLNVAAAALLGTAGLAFGQAINETFDNVAGLTAAGWTMTNMSDPIGTTGWFQGNITTTGFPAHTGEGYIGANFNNTGSTVPGTISNWLILPPRTLQNGDVVKFWSRTTIDQMWADRLALRMSLAGTGANVGTSATSVGDFTTELLVINPDLQLGGAYPSEWTEYSVTLSGIPAPTVGRLAFWYNVTNAGLAGLNADYIGIDDVTYTPGAATCYPDCNGDGLLNLSDFGCFTTQFALGMAYADCNGDGIRNLADFGCFTTKFALGCP